MKSLGFLVVVLCGSVMLGSGCAAFRSQTVETDVDNMGHMKAHYDATDMRNITQSVVNKLLGSKFLAEQADEPIMVIAGVENRTTQYVDTKNLTDRMRTLLIQSEAVKFINAARRDDLLKEQGYQTANVTPGQAAAIGQQLGASFMISGSLTEMKRTQPKEVRISKTEVRYYKLTIEVTDVTTGLIEWTTEDEFARSARTPLIGW